MSVPTAGGPTQSPRRTYDSSKRQAAAHARRERVLDVASRRFVEEGWSRTSVAAVAAEAGVSPELVSRAFGDKAALLMAAFRRTSFGALPDLQAAFGALRLGDEPDLGVRLDRFVEFACNAFEAMTPLVPALHRAADQDESARRLVERARERRRGTSAELVALLSPPGAVVRPGAADVVYVITSGETYLQFMGEVGWTREDFAPWLRQALQDAVCGAMGS